MAHKRDVHTVVLSDTHLGTYGCHAKELLSYLKSIRPKIILLNGDIIDIWNFKKRYFPKSHLKVLKYLIHLAQKGTEVYYITGNHDEMLRKFADSDLGNIHLRNQITLRFGDQKAWIFHGDIFDASIQNARWLAKIGGWSYDALIWFNQKTNKIMKILGREPYSLSKVIKDSVKKAVKYIGDFEQAAAELAKARGFDLVICGHIHQPQMRNMVTAHGSIQYLNSGDWIENLTALEWTGEEWSLFFFPQGLNEPEEHDDKVYASPKELLSQLLSESSHAKAS